MIVPEISSGHHAVEFAANMLDRHDLIDASAPTLIQVTGITQHRMPTATGLSECDYPEIASLTSGLKHLNQIETMNKIPIPPEVMEHFKHIKCHCMMGLFPEIGRAWLTIDSDIYIWTYEHTRDVAYYDGLSDLIVSVGLVTPKPGVFISDIKHLLVITTPIEIVVLGVTFGDSVKSVTSPGGTAHNTATYEEVQLMNKPIFILSTENVAITTIAGTADHRIFLGGRDGSLFEIGYQSESNWFGKRYKKINHSQGLMSYIVPGFFKAFSEADSISKIVVDNSRCLLYTLSEKGAIEAWDLGEDATETRRIARVTQNDMVHQASNILKTVDASIFKPIVSICPLNSEDSANLHLIAITQSGVRLYFSTINVLDNVVYPPGTPTSSPMTYEVVRPQSLYLLHVRLPPGYATVGKPKNIHSAYYCNGTLLMVSTPQPDQDLLWSLSSEPFSVRPYLAESCTRIELNGQVWGIAEMQDSNSHGSLVNPLKKARTNKQIVLLTNQGAHIIALAKPMGLLKQLLVSCHGPHHDAVKSYFLNQNEQQTCAVSLLIACSEAFRGTEIGMWATQALILYGGEPQFYQPDPQMMVSTPFASRHSPNFFQQQQQQLQQHQQFPLSPISNQNIWWQQQAQLRQPQQHFQYPLENFTFSAKHGGIYLYLGRLLRSLWKKKCVVQPCQSSITPYDCCEILEELYSLRVFLEGLPDKNVAGFLHNNPIIGNGFNHSSVISNQQNAYTEEKQSIMALLSLIKHACEVLALWKILCEHQFNLLFIALPPKEQEDLSAYTFRDLILSRGEICALLIASLINSYLSDNATVGSISSKLRDVCPSLYRHENAVLHKATEILLLSKNCTDQEERQEKLYTALQLCKDAAPDLPLRHICEQFILAKYYQGVVELCATCASKKDPNNAAIHYYSRGEPPEDQEGYAIYIDRTSYYDEIKRMLSHIYESQNVSNQVSVDVPQLPDNNVSSDVLRVVSLCLQTRDQLLHVAVYDWLLTNNLHSELLNISEPTLGEFLAHSISKSPNNLVLADILWKYHERNGEHAEATQILDNLASIENGSGEDGLTLTKRIEYLARAVMCMRSDAVGYSANNGVLLKNLEDKLDIARVQKIIQDTLSTLENQQCVKSLNDKLYTMSELYANYAERYQLSECKLTIVNYSHHNDPLLIESIWMEIIDNELNTPGSPGKQAQNLLTKVHKLAKEYGAGGHCFPLAFLVRELELRCCRLRLKESPVPTAFVNTMSVDFDLLLDIYSRMISMNERIWGNEGNEWHLVQSTTILVGMLAAQPHIIPQRNRRRIVGKTNDLISACRNLLYPKPGTQDLVNALDKIENELHRMPYN